MGMKQHMLQAHELRHNWFDECNAAGWQVLLALQRLVNALGPDSPGSYSLLLPILQQCTSIDQVCPDLNFFQPGMAHPLPLQQQHHTQAAVRAAYECFNLSSHSFFMS